MRCIQSRHLGLALGCVVGAALCAALGCLFHPLFLAAGGFGIGYLVLERKYLRCPYCGGFTNLDRLLYARHHEYHCSSCGKRLEIQ